MGVQGQDFKADLLGPNPKPPKGMKKANLSPRTKALLEEVALSEQVGVMTCFLSLHSKRLAKRGLVVSFWHRSPRLADSEVSQLWLSSGTLLQL